jgi:ribulose-5-phosphate 4-epimerase/fuculose-1-phosphate aldolase
MPQQEGVIKFRLEHTLSDPLSQEKLAELNTWREWMFARGLIGETNTPQAKVGYGNISCRMLEGFAITGSQTGHLAHLTPKEYALVTDCRPEQNLVISQGPTKPSSESLTHAVLYQLDEKINWVMHAHHAPIWGAAKELGLPCTSPDVAYGTPEMAVETIRLFAETDVRQKGIFAMAGHEEGIVSFGETPEQAAEVLSHYLILCRR